MLLPKITGTMLRAGRVFAHLSQDQLANRAGIPRDCDLIAYGSVLALRQSALTGGGKQDRFIESGMSNIVSGRQIRAARILAGLTQADLARAIQCHPRSVRYWEHKGNSPPTNVASTLHDIEQALNRHGVVPFSTPTPGVRLL